MSLIMICMSVNGSQLCGQPVKMNIVANVFMGVAKLILDLSGSHLH